jgi:hypothetical protein
MEITELDAALPLVADRCPYSRDFGPDFHDCVAYTQEEFTALDTRYRPLRPVPTCRHLAIGTEATGAYYPRCALGTAEARSRWANEVGPDRLRALRELAVEYRTWVGELMPRVWESKGRLLAAQAEGGDAKAAAAELRAHVDELLRAVQQWIGAHAARLSEVGLDPEILKELVTVATHTWVDSPAAGLGYQVPDHVLEQFPPQIQVFIRAGRQ